MPLAKNKLNKEYVGQLSLGCRMSLTEVGLLLCQGGRPLLLHVPFALSPLPHSPLRREVDAVGPRPARLIPRGSLLLPRALPQPRREEREF